MGGFLCHLNIFLLLVPLFIVEWLSDLQCPEQAWFSPWATRGGIWLQTASPSVVEWARKIWTGRDFFSPFPFVSAARRGNGNWPMSYWVNIGPQSWRPPGCRAWRLNTPWVPAGCIVVDISFPWCRTLQLPPHTILNLCKDPPPVQWGCSEVLELSASYKRLLLVKLIR